jgi:putative RecB family exonuclease
MKEATAIPLYSHSKLETFRQCPLKFKLRYIDSLETEIVGVEAFLGSRVHETLQKLYQEVQAEEIPNLGQLLEFYESSWRSQWHDRVLIVKRERTQLHYFELGVACIRNYYAKNKPFNQATTVSLEQRVGFYLDDKRQRQFQGFVDRISFQPDGTYEIHDYKTSRYVPTRLELSDLLHKDGIQLSLYQIAVSLEHPEAKSIDLVWHYLSRGVTYRLRRKEPDLAQILRSTIHLIERIESERHFRPIKTRLCHWCEFRQSCPAWV